MKRSKKFSKKRKFSTRKQQLLIDDVFSHINSFVPNRSIPVLSPYIYK